MKDYKALYHELLNKHQEVLNSLDTALDENQVLQEQQNKSSKPNIFPTKPDKKGNKLRLLNFGSFKS